MLGIFKGKLSVFKGSVMSTELLIKADLEHKHLEEAFSLAVEYERWLSAYREDSYITKINRNAGIKPVECPPEVIEVIGIALRVAERSKGLYDPTIGVLTQGLFGFGTKREKIPDEEEVKLLLRLVDYKKVKVSENTVFLKERGMRLDLGGVAKGWTAQKLAEFLMEKGASKALVSVGGEICCFGKEWRVAVKEDKEKYLGIIETTKEKTTISTSGTYERFINNPKFHHIINPKRGMQESFYTSLTLVSKGFLGGELDALTTACFNLPSAEINNLTEKYLFIDNNGNVGIGKYFRAQVKGIYLFGA